MNEPQAERRQEGRRKEDKQLRKAVDSLMFAVFGSQGHPETGLMARLTQLEKKIDRNTWALVAAALALAGAVVQNVLT